MKMRRGAGMLLVVLLGLTLPGLAWGTAIVAAPAFTPTPRMFKSPVTVTIISKTAGTTIYYTTDGSAPSRLKSPVYKGPVPINATSTLKAIAFKTGLRASPTTSGLYRIAAPPPPSESGGTLFLASLTPQAGSTSTGSGAASLVLTQDQTAAVLRYSYSGLTGPLTSQHIHGPDAAILFDLDTTAPQADGSRVWRIQPTGTYDTAKILSSLRDGELYLNLHTAAFPAGEIKGFFHAASGSQTFTPPPPPPALPGGSPTPQDAARFLFQATYGPRPGEVEVLQQKGFPRFLDEQMAMPTVSHLATYDQLLATSGEDPNPGLVRESFMAQAVQGPDQLRQRVTFALSEMFVISDQDSTLRKNPEALASYLDLLARDSFGNFRDLLADVTLSPAMGVYLDMAGSSKSIPDKGVNPNENYAREILQLFSIGLYELHPDGTLRLDATNQPIPTYDQDVVKAFARAFTGWTLGGQSQADPRKFFHPDHNFRVPMEPWALYHATDSKQLLDGTVLPAGQSARTDLGQSLDLIFRHPNTGPIFCRGLIQKLITSNPSPAYVYRCGQAFADNGSGVRGDLKAVLRAILLDYEARAASLATRPDEGHLREPVVRVAGLLRTLDARPRNGRWKFARSLDQPGKSTSQTPLHSPTVFNFFAPDYQLPGEIAQSGLVAPELQITTETTAVGTANLQKSLLGAGGPTSLLVLNLAPFQTPQVAGDEALLDRVNQLLFAGAMSDATRGILRGALADPAFPRQANPRVITLLWLASLAPESVVQK
jgi:uncharacterized protein (DUF1800 family)